MEDGSRAAHVGRHRSSLIDCPVRRSQMSYRSACHRRQVIVPRRARRPKARKSVFRRHARARTLSARARPLAAVVAAIREITSGRSRSRGDLSPPLRLTSDRIGEIFSSLPPGRGGRIGFDSSHLSRARPRSEV